MRSRPTTDAYFLKMAQLVATRGTCIRRTAGCVLVDKDNRVLATGYNGVASGMVHCTDSPCPGANSPSGTDLHLCQATHAEANALISCRHPEDIVTCYTTVSPCIYCTRLLLNTACERIIFIEEYPHLDARDLWLSQRRFWLHKNDFLKDDFTKYLRPPTSL